MSRIVQFVLRAGFPVMGTVHQIQSSVMVATSAMIGQMKRTVMTSVRMRVIMAPEKLTDVRLMVRLHASIKKIFVMVNLTVRQVQMKLNVHVKLRQT